MTKKALLFLSLFLLAGTLMMLVPSETMAQGPLCPKPYAFAWDWGVAPFDSPFGYLSGPVDPFSAEWGPLDGCYGCWWASNVWALGYDMDPDRWWYYMWLQTGSRKKDSDPRGQDGALVRPIPALTLSFRGSPPSKRASPGSGAAPASLLSSHQGPTYHQPQANAGNGGTHASSGGGSGRAKR